MIDEETFKVDVNFHGRRHTVVISGSWHPSIGLIVIGRTPDPPPASARLRLSCPDCDTEGMFRITAPTSEWKRPFKVVQVTHINQPT